MRWINKSITRIFGLAILFVILLLSAADFYIINFEVRDAFEKQEKEQLTINSKHISSEIETYFEKYVVIVQQAKNNPDFINVSREIEDRNTKRENPLYATVTKQLMEIKNIDENIESAFIALSSANDLITETYDYESTPDYSLANRNWYIETIKKEKLSLSAPYNDLVTGKRIITISAPLEYREKIVGVIGIDILIEDVKKIISNYKVGDNGYASIVYNDGRILYHPDYYTKDLPTTVTLKDILGDATNELLSRKNGITTAFYKDKERYIAYSPINNTDLIVFTIIPVSDVFSTANELIITDLSILIGVLLLTAIILIFLNISISSPIVKLSKEIENYGNKKSRIIIPEKQLHRYDEIGVLSRGLSHMSDEISNYILDTERQNNELRNAKEAITLERSLFKTTIQSLNNGVISTDEFGKIRIINKVAENLIDTYEENVIGINIEEVLNISGTSTSKNVRSIIEEVLYLGKVIEEQENTFLDNTTGKKIPIEFSVSPILDEHGKISGTVILFSDCSEKIKRQDEILYLSYHDSLTGLYNRRFFEEELKRMDNDRSLPLSVVMADVNGLKLTNDAFGHAVGNELLIRIANIFKEESRSTDILARVGGDEFELLLPNTTSEEVEKMVKRMYNAVSQEFFYSMATSVSIGYYTKTQKETPIENVINKAEEYMYRKKLTESQSMRSQTIQVVFKTLNEKNERERIHSERVSKFSRMIGEKMNLDPEVLKEIEFSGLMHDIGKIAISESILNKPGKLTEDEYKEIKRHPEVGYQILRSVDEYTSLADCALSHHERWDGKGYPRGLKEKEIPLNARIIAVADSFEAMTAIRPYKKELSVKEAIEELVANSGTQFDPEIVNVFVNEVMV